MDKVTFIWNKLINIGSEEKRDSISLLKLRLLNSIGWMGIGISIFNSFLYYFTHAYKLIFPSTSGVLFFIIPIFFNYIKKYQTAKFTASIGIATYFALYSLYIGKDFGLEYMLLVTCIAPVMFFENKKLRLFIFIYNLLLFIAIKILFIFLKYGNTYDYTLNYYFNFIVIFVVLFIIVLIFKQENDAYEKVISQTNKRITDSIKYASRIQKAIFLTEDELRKNFNDLFLFYSPKNIVSGDFYWYNTLVVNEEEYQIIVAADCTGHGVPGAFMTVMGNDFLEQIVTQEKTFMPNEILSKLDIKISQRLLNNKNDFSLNDGMDMSIITINKTKNALYYSGAKSHLFIDFGNELVNLKGSKFPIGGHILKKYKKKYELHTCTKPQDIKNIYMFSDGFQDQNGGPLGKKYKLNQLYEFILTIRTLPFAEQKLKIQNEFDNWTNQKYKKYPQLDDILILGIKLRD